MNENIKHTKMGLTKALRIVALASCIGIYPLQTIAATTIDFGGLPGDSSTFTTYKEDSFTIVPLLKPWISISYGKPGPSIVFINPDVKNDLTASIKVTGGNFTFKFNSVDLYSSVTKIPYIFTGYLKSNMVFKVTGTEPNTFGNFATVTNPHNMDVIDRLDITLTNPAIPTCPSCSGNPMGLDNIVLLSSMSIHATALSPNAVQLSWNNVPGDKGLRIQRKAGNCSSTKPWVTRVDMSANNTDVVDSNLTPNTPYSYQVASYYGAQSFSPYSACASATTGKTGTPTMPGAVDLPGGLSAVSQSDTQVVLGWVDESSNETEFAIYRKADTGNWTQIDSVAANTQSYRDVGAAGNTSTTSYSYDVRACNSAGCSMANPNPVVVPFSPINLAATVGSTVHLTWSDESSNESGFQIWRKNGNCASATPWVGIMPNLAANTTSYNDSSAVSGQVYTYKVFAFRFTAGWPLSVGHSSFSGCVTATAP
jgi:hypothetical protein